MRPSGRVVAERSVKQLIRLQQALAPVALGASSTVKPAREGSGGVIGSENVDMSSDKEGERPSRRKSKGSCLKLI